MVKSKIADSFIYHHPSHPSLWRIIHFWYSKSICHCSQPCHYNMFFIYNFHFSHFLFSTSILNVLIIKYFYRNYSKFVINCTFTSIFSYSMNEFSEEVICTLSKSNLYENPYFGTITWHTFYIKIKHAYLGFNIKMFYFTHYTRQRFCILYYTVLLRR